METVAGEQYPEFAHLTSWDDILQAAADVRVERDQQTWRLGDLAAYACTAPKGRPKSGGEPRTVGAFAAAIGEKRSVVNEWVNNARFFDADMRAELPANVSWRQCAEARRRSGWKPGQPITDEHRLAAFAHIGELADRGEIARPRPFDLAGSIERHRAGVLRLIEAEDTPAQVGLALQGAERSLAEAAGLLEG